MALEEIIPGWQQGGYPGRPSSVTELARHQIRRGIKIGSEDDLIRLMMRPITDENYPYPYKLTKEQLAEIYDPKLSYPGRAIEIADQLYGASETYRIDPQTGKFSVFPAIEGLLTGSTAGRSFSSTSLSHPPMLPISKSVVNQQMLQRQAYMRSLEGPFNLIGPPVPDSIESIEDSIAAIRAQIVNSESEWGTGKLLPKVEEYKSQLKILKQKLKEQLNYINQYKKSFNNEVIDTKVSSKIEARIRSLSEQLEIEPSRLEYKIISDELNPFRPTDDQLKKIEKQARVAEKLAEKEKISKKVSEFDTIKQLKQSRDRPPTARITQKQTEQAGVSALSPVQTPGKVTQSTAKMIEQDSFRAASVLHSSKMGYAAVGAAALMGIAGFNEITGRKKRIQRNIEQG